MTACTPSITSIFLANHLIVHVTGTFVQELVYNVSRMLIYEWLLVTLASLSCSVVNLSSGLFSSCKMTLHCIAIKTMLLYFHVLNHIYVFTNWRILNYCSTGSGVSILGYCTNMADSMEEDQLPLTSRLILRQRKHSNSHFQVASH